MLELERETFDPSGISTVDPPKRILNGVLISKPCGILYHIDGSSGIRCVFVGWGSTSFLTALQYVELQSQYHHLWVTALVI